MTSKRFQPRTATPEEKDIIASETILGTRVELIPYHDKEDNRTILSIYHNDYRHVWIEQNDTMNYINRRAHGQDEDDETCYYEPHRSYSDNRQDWPDVLFQYESEPRSRRPEKPKWLFTEEGWLVLDFNSNPVLDYKMPLTLCSMCEGWLLETIMRENYCQHIGVRDLMARMPGKIVDDKEPSHVNTVSMRMTRFRKEAGSISWNPKVGSDAIKAYLDMKLPESCKQANSTRGFRNLYKHEQAEIELINVGKFPSKARHGKRDFSPKNKETKLQEAINKAMRLKAEFDRQSNPALAINEWSDNMLHLGHNPDLVEFQSRTAYLEYLHSLPDLLDSDTSSIDADITSSATSVSRDASIDNAFSDSHSSRFTQQASSPYETFQQPWFPFDPSARGPAATPSLISNVRDSVIDTQVASPQLNSDMSLSDPEDLRDLTPATRAHRTLISFLLAPTIRNYTYLTNQQAPATNPEGSYLEQFGQLHAAFEEYVAAHYVDTPFDDLQLVGLMLWTERGLDWNLLWDEEAFGEAPDTGIVEALMDGM